MNGARSEEQQKLDVHTEALMRLAQQLVVNNNTVSGAMRLMSENIEEVSSMCERLEDKFDAFITDASQHADIWDSSTCIQIKDLIKKLDDSGIVKFLSFAKKIIIALTTTVVVAGLIYAGKSIYTAMHLVNSIKP